VESVPITTKAVSSNHVHSELYSVQHCLIKLGNDLRQVCCFLRFHGTPSNLPKGKAKLIIQQTDKISQQPENWENCNGPDLVQAFPREWWIESDVTAPNLSFPLWLEGSGRHNSIYTALILLLCRYMLVNF
jgi:hypothetical protein